MHKLFYILSVLISIIMGGCTSSSDRESSNWMAHLADSIRICKLSIPSTHDSGARLGGEFLQTQDLSVPEQLEEGIRGFDIRLEAIGDSLLGVYHASQFQHITWENEVLPAFLSFLSRHPSEMLIVSLKCEGGSKEAYRRLLSQSLSDSSYVQHFVWDFSPLLTLQECRGKILFIHRDAVMEDYPGGLCFNWGDNTTGEMTLRGYNNKEAIVSVEDEYQYASVSGASYKSEITLQHIRKSSVEPAQSNRWFISFASATALPSDGPKAFAEKVNRYLSDSSLDKLKGGGIILVDFAGSAYGKKVIRQVIDSNFIDH